MFLLFTGVQGDPKLGQAGHPRCEFCKTRFYDAAQLHDHLVKDHYSCHICERQGILHKYYRDYTDLERHFRSGHFLCEEVSSPSASLALGPWR